MLVGFPAFSFQSVTASAQTRADHTRLTVRKQMQMPGVNVLMDPPSAGTGTFTDAKIAKTGLFKTASKGIPFSDKIDVLPLPLQSKLPTAVEEKWCVVSAQWRITRSTSNSLRRRRPSRAPMAQPPIRR